VEKTSILFRSTRPFDRRRVIRDALAGIELAAMNIPQSLGYTKIAGTPVITGLYTLLLPLVAFAAFGSSRYLVVAADSATAAILASHISTMAAIASPRYMELVGLVALLTAGMLLLARVLRLGFLADFLSRTVLVGFLSGVGFQIGIAVLGDMIGVEVHARRTVGQLLQVITRLPQVHLPTLELSLAVIAALVAAQRFAPRIPGPLIVVAAAVGASAHWSFAAHGILTIGPVAGGLPHFGPPGTNMNWKEVEALLPVAASCFVMIVAQSSATARVYALRHHEQLDQNADLAGLSAANAAAALTGTFVVNGSPTQTAMVESSGAQSQVAQLATAGVVGLVLLFFTRPLSYLPNAALAAIVFLIGVKLVDFRGLVEIRRSEPSEFTLAIITGLTVVLLGVEQGIILAVLLSLLAHVRHSYRPHTAVIMRDPAGHWRLEDPVPGKMIEPGLVMYWFGRDLFYANAPFFAQQAHELVDQSPAPVRWLVVDGTAITGMDYFAARTLGELQQDLAKAGVVLALILIQIKHRGTMERMGLIEQFGRDKIFDSRQACLDAYRSSVQAKPAAAAPPAAT